MGYQPQDNNSATIMRKTSDDVNDKCIEKRLNDILYNIKLNAEYGLYEIEIAKDEDQLVLNNLKSLGYKVSKHFFLPTITISWY